MTVVAGLEIAFLESLDLGLETQDYLSATSVTNTRS